MFCSCIFHSNFLNSKLSRIHLHGAIFFVNQIVLFMRGNSTHGTNKMVPLNKSSTYSGLHVKNNLLKQIQGISGNGSAYQKFHLTVVPLVESQLYFLQLFMWYCIHELVVLVFFMKKPMYFFLLIFFQYVLIRLLICVLCNWIGSYLTWVLTLPLLSAFFSIWLIFSLY